MRIWSGERDGESGLRMKNIDQNRDRVCGWIKVIEILVEAALDIELSYRSTSLISDCIVCLINPGFDDGGSLKFPDRRRSVNNVSKTIQQASSVTPSMSAKRTRVFQLQPDDRFHPISAQI